MGLIMKLHIINSGSSGNCYILENSESALMLEAGCKLDLVKKAINFNTLKLKAMLVSHGHL